VLVLDDLQWADAVAAASASLVRSPADSMLIIGTYRDADLDRSPLCNTLSDLRRDDLFDRIVLRGLSEHELGQFLLSRFGYSPSPEFVGTLVAETYGNPFFAGEVMAHLVESDLVGSFDGSSPELPIDGRHVGDCAIYRSASGATSTGVVSSRLGARPSVQVPRSSSTVLEDELLAHLDNAVRAGLIREDPTHPGRYVFTHALIRQKLYGDLGTTRRVGLHWLAGVSLQSCAAHDVDAVAYHLSEGVLAGNAVRAVDASLVAGTRAVEMSAFETAVDHFGNALALLEQTGTSDGDRRAASSVSAMRTWRCRTSPSTDAYLRRQGARSQGR
jgi:predicted ATPase